MNTRSIVIFILLFGALLRLVGLNQIPLSLYWDEAAIGYDAFMIAETGKTMHGNPWYSPIMISYGDYKAPVYIVLSSVFIHIFGQSMLSVRIVSAIFGIGLIGVGYLLGKELINRTVGIFGALIIAISPWAIQFSRAGFEANAGAFFTMTAVWLWLKGKQRGWLLVLSSIVGLLGVYSYFSVRVVLPLMIIALSIFYWRSYASKLAYVTLAIGVFYLGLLPLLNSPFYEASNQFRMSTNSILNTDEHVTRSNAARQIHNFSLISRLIYHRYIFWVQSFLDNIFAHYSLDYVFFSGDSNLRHGTGAYGLFVWPLLFVLPGVLFAKQLLRPKFILLSLWLVSVIPASIPLEIPHALRSLNGLVPSSLLLAIGLFYLWKTYRRLAIGLLLLIGLIFGGYVHDYYSHYPSRSAVDWQDGYIPLAKTIYSLRDSYDEIYIEEFDRFYLYYLYFSGIKTTEDDTVQMLAWQPTYIDSTYFSLPSTIPINSNVLLVFGAETYNQYRTNLKLVDVINSYSSEPLYYLATPTDEEIEL